MKTKGFTLIELLIVVAIIAILAAIAVPNFLEAQTRSKIARSQADLRSIDLAMQSYIVDWNTKPPAARRITSAGRIYDWWGFCSSAITTPVAYITSIPPQIFWDKAILGQWTSGAYGPGASQDNQPYTYIRNSALAAMWQPGTIAATAAPYNTMPVSYIFHEQVMHAAFVIYTCGPDRLDTTVYGAPEIYDPTNGTMSNGDIHRFGPGQPSEKPTTDFNK